MVTRSCVTMFAAGSMVTQQPATARAVPVPGRVTMPPRKRPRLRGYIPPKKEMPKKEIDRPMIRDKLSGLGTLHSPGPAGPDRQRFPAAAR